MKSCPQHLQMNNDNIKIHLHESKIAKTSAWTTKENEDVQSKNELWSTSNLQYAKNITNSYDWEKEFWQAFPTKYFQKIIILFGLSQGLQALIIPRKWMNI